MPRAGAGGAAGDTAATAPPPSTCPPASTASSAHARRAAERGACTGSRGAGRGLARAPACRCGSRADVAGHLLRDAMELEGLSRRGTSVMANRTVASAAGAGATAASCRSSSTPAPARTACRRGRRASSTRERRAPRTARDPRLDRLGARHLLPQLEVGRKARLGCRPPDLLDAASRPAPTSSRRSPASARRRGRRPRCSATCCGFAGDRGLLHPELTASATARRGGRARRPRASTRTSARTAPARSASSSATGRALRVVRASCSSARRARAEPETGGGEMAEANCPSCHAGIMHTEVRENGDIFCKKEDRVTGNVGDLGQRLPAELHPERSVMVATTMEIPGFDAQEFKGPVFGLVVMSRNMFSDFGSVDQVEPRWRTARLLEAAQQCQGRGDRTRPDGGASTRRQRGHRPRLRFGRLHLRRPDRRLRDRRDRPPPDRATTAGMSEGAASLTARIPDPADPVPRVAVPTLACCSPPGRSGSPRRSSGSPTSCPGG